MPRHLESQEQRLFVQRFRMDPRTRDWPACAIPNGGKRGPREAAILKGEGVSAGAPDWVCFRFVHQDTGQIPRTYSGLALEFKTPTLKGRLTLAQREWHDKLRAEGWVVVTVTSAEEAWAVLCDTYQLQP